MSSRTEQAIETRAGRAVEMGQVVVEALVKEPVKEAVREALVEDRLRQEESADGGYGLPDPKILLPLLGLVAAAVYAGRRIGSTMDVGTPGEEVGRRDEEATSSVDAGEDATTVTSEHAPPSGSTAGREIGSSDEDTDRDADEEATARS